MAEIKDLEQRVAALEGAEDQPSRWWDVIDIEIPILLVAIALTAYGCERADAIKSRRVAFDACVAAKDLSPACKAVIESSR